MFDIQNYIDELTERLQILFGDRLLYVGLQGSYLRGEATENSDIDIMVVLDGLHTADLHTYRSVIEAMEGFDKSCGFICSREDLMHWNPLEICHVLHSTKDCYGVLRDLTPAYTEQDVRNFIKFSVNNLYHEICHRYIHADRISNMEALPFTYKGVFFVLQNLFYLTHGEFIASKAALLQRLEGKNRAVLERSIAMNNGELYDFEESFQLLFSWCQETIKSV